MRLIDGTRIRVTAHKEERKYTNDDNVYLMYGSVVADFEGVDKYDVSYTNHILSGDILVYFNTLDFCLWLAEGEYEIAEKS